MSIENDSFDQVIFYCDDCGEELHTYEENFSAAIAVLRDRGWKNFKDEHGEWTHNCGCSVNEFN